MQASGRWLPPALLRPGQTVAGEVTLPLLRPRPFAWQLLVGGGPVPLASLTVDHLDLTSFLRRTGQTVMMLGGKEIMRCIYVVDAGRIEDDDEPDAPPLTRRHRVTARGSIVLIANGVQRTVVINHLAGHAWTTFTRVPGGYHPDIRIAIEESDAELITVPVLGDVRPLLLRQLESAANEGLVDGLEGVVLPGWFPLDANVDVTVR
jgi:hypothetical protein